MSFFGYYSSEKKTRALNKKKRLIDILNVTLDQLRNPKTGMLLPNTGGNYYQNCKAYYDNNSSFKSDFCTLYRRFEPYCLLIIYHLACNPGKYKRGILDDMYKTKVVKELTKKVEENGCVEDPIGYVQEIFKEKGWKEGDPDVTDALLCYFQKKAKWEGAFFAYYTDHNGNLAEIRGHMQKYAEIQAQIKAQVENTAMPNKKKKGEISERVMEELAKEIELNNDKKWKEKHKKGGLPDNYKAQAIEENLKRVVAHYETMMNNRLFHSDSLKKLTDALINYYCNQNIGLTQSSNFSINDDDSIL